MPPLCLEPLEDFGPHAAGQHVYAVGEGHEDRQHAGGAHAAQARIAFGEEHAGALPRGGHRRGHARRSAAGDEDVDRVADRNVALEIQLVLGRFAAGQFRGLRRPGSLRLRRPANALENLDGCSTWWVPR